MRCSTKPIQNPVPKNSYGVKPEKRLVAKNIAMMGRMVATASPTEKARIIHSRCSATSRCRICQNALHSANRKNIANSKNTATQAVPSEIVGANGRTELQWPQCHKKQARHNMNES